MDTDDNTGYVSMVRNVQLYGSSLKSDFGGHSLSVGESLFLYASAGNQYQASVASLPNSLHDSIIVAAGEGEQLIHAGCPPGKDPTMSPRLLNVSVLTPAGNSTLCGKPLAQWEDRLLNVTAGVAPEVSIVMGWARAILGMPPV